MSQAKPFFSVIIVNYEADDYLKPCIESVLNQSFEDFEIILVDNDSKDKSLETITSDEAIAGKIHILAEQKNHGFAVGNNIAVAKANGQWIALLNPDAVADPDWLQAIHEAIERHPNVKAFASAQLDLNDTSMMDGAGDAYLGFGFPWRGGFGRPATEMPDEGLCFAACGAGAIYEHALFTQMGGFEESHFCYCEDVELGFRLQLAGQPCVFLPNAIISHAGSAISGRHSHFSTYYGTRNRIWTYLRCMPSLLFWATLPIHLGFSFYLLLRHTLMGLGPAHFKGLKDGFSSTIALRKSGSSLRKNRAVSLVQISKTMCWNPLRMNARKPFISPVKK